MLNTHQKVIPKIILKISKFKLILVKKTLMIQKDSINRILMKTMIMLFLLKLKIIIKKISKKDLTKITAKVL